MNTKYIIIAILFLVILSSCKKVLELPTSDIDGKIVINAIIQSDSSFYADVFRSSSVSDNIMKIQYLNNAVVQVFEDNQLIDRLSLDTAGHYIGTNAVAQTGHTYRYEVSANKLPPVKATASLPKKIDIISVDSVGSYTLSNMGYYGYYSDNGNPYGVYKVKFNDPSGEDNYYRLSVANPLIPIIDTFIYYDSYTQQFDTIINVYTQQIVSSFSDDPSIDVWDYLDGYYYFSDRLFDGKEYNFDLKIQLNDDKDRYIQIYLEQISKEFYNYMVSLDLQDDTDDMPLFFQPVQVYNNIENGYGILGVATVSADSVFLYGQKYE